MHLHCNLIYVPSSCKNCLFCNKEQTQLPPHAPSLSIATVYLNILKIAQGHVMKRYYCG